ncbi:unnamed protein product [Lactuca virosa]|uniref:Uncharacterized protein n=1 Tax=Lactuca virosa TaxID=75947 RepID=A0AAU9N7F3_9ASTR|nr:unnamed protein product [Lactuca virosa]
MDLNKKTRHHLNEQIKLSSINRKYVTDRLRHDWRVIKNVVFDSDSVHRRRHLPRRCRHVHFLKQTTTSPINPNPNKSIYLIIVASDLSFFAAINLY